MTATAPEAARDNAAEPALSNDGSCIAIVGMAGRFPGSPDLESYWDNLSAGRESVQFFTREQLHAAGVPAELACDPAYVPARATLADAELFDADFFGFSPREAELMDPQFRVFLECAYQACESAGYGRLPPRGGVFAGMGANAYLLHLARQLDGRDPSPVLNALILNDKDYLATLVSYKLDLRGPALTVQSACSTSLVAVHLAAQSLLVGECDIALAGGVSISFPQQVGYRFESNGVLSPDGHCRAFDARGQGIVEGNGVGVVLLKRLEDALAAGDTIRAVLRGSAVNNDGAVRIGYTAPGVEGQARVVAEALAVAGVDASSIGYVEAHGTGTPMGDPIEVAALARAHGKRTSECVLGSVKTNIGHLGAASGIAGLLKAVLALEHGQIPATLHFETANRRLELEAAGFAVASSTRSWPAGSTPRRAGVSSFGIGGTNAHVILEQAPPAKSVPLSDAPSLLVWSARTPSALEALTEKLKQRLQSTSAEELPDVAFTLQVGRTPFAHRRACAARTPAEALAALSANGSSVRVGEKRPKLVYLLPGLGDQYPGMSRDLYRDHAPFRAALDRYADAFVAEMGLDVRELLLEPSDRQGEAGDRAGALRIALGQRAASGGALAQTRLAQPAIFAQSCALAECLQGWGIKPDLLLGHSFGEYTAAHLAGVFSFADAIKLVSQRARLLDELEPGALLSVLLSPREVERYLGGRIYLSALNAPEICTLGGPPADIERLQTQLAEDRVVCVRLAASHAFHSPMMRPALEPLQRFIASLKLAAPKIPYISNVTGAPVLAADAMDPRYWARHLRETVRFSEGVLAACAAPMQVLLELGPGTALGSFARMSGVDPTRATLLSCLPRELEARAGHTTLLDSVGKLWCAGIEPDWSRLAPARRRVPLPTYPFERSRHLATGTRQHALPRVEPARAQGTAGFACGWALQEGRLARAVPSARGPALVIHDGSTVARALLEALAESSALTRVELAGAFQVHADGQFSVDPTRQSDWLALQRELATSSEPPEHVLLVLGRAREEASSDADSAGILAALLALRTALAGQGPLRLSVLAGGLVALNESEIVDPGRAALIGAGRVLAAETPDLTLRLLDFAALGDGPGQTPFADVAHEVWTGSEPLLALRGRQRFAPELRALSGSTNPSASLLVVLDDAASVGASFAQAWSKQTEGRRFERVAHASDLAASLARVESEHGPISGLVWSVLHDVTPRALEQVARANGARATLTHELAAVEQALEQRGIGDCWLLLPSSALVGGAGTFEQATLACHAGALAELRNRNARVSFFPVFLAASSAATWSGGLPQCALPVALGELDLPAISARSLSSRPEAARPARPRATLGDSSYVAPDSEVERTVAGIWGDLLGISRVGANDNFFEFGGQSLMGLQLLSRIKESYGVELTLRDLFDAPTVAEQSFLVESALLNEVEVAPQQGVEGELS